jgi:hypothetical protein
MEIVEVTGKGTVEKFHDLPKSIYRNDQNYIPLLKMAVEDVFNPGKNNKFKNGNAKRWLLMNGNECIGRIAAFYDADYSTAFKQPTGCFGFFECIENQDAATQMFDVARDWLVQNGMEAMDGPVNFGENFFNWGLLVDGFVPQTFGMQYNLPYYRTLFEKYGFRNYYNQFSYSLNISNPDLPERFWKIAEWVTKKPGYRFEHFTFKEQDRYIRDFIEIHGQAWRNHGNYKPVNFDQLKEVIRSSELFLDEEFLWYAYFEGTPIAFFIMIPDLNQVIRKLKTGKLNFLRTLKFMFLLKTKTITRCRVIVLGVVPKFQRMGIESGIFWQLKRVMQRRSWYKEMEMSWIGDFNPKMNVLFKSFGASQSLTHVTYRYLFDRNKDFERAPIIE